MSFHVTLANSTLPHEIENVCGIFNQFLKAAGLNKVNALPKNPKDFEHIIGETLLASLLLTNVSLKENGDFFGFMSASRPLKICQDAAFRLWAYSDEVREVLLRSGIKIRENDADATISRFRNVLHSIYDRRGFQPADDILNYDEMKKSGHVLVVSNGGKALIHVRSIPDAPTWTIL